MLCFDIKERNLISLICYVKKVQKIFHFLPSFYLFMCTANMYSGITVEVHWKNCTFEKLQFFTVDHSSLYFSHVKNCNFSIIFHGKWNHQRILKKNCPFENMRALVSFWGVKTYLSKPFTEMKHFLTFTHILPL